MPPEVEGPQKVHITIEIESFGKASQVQREALVAVGRALSLIYKDKYRMFLGGKRIAYDPLAHDGEHVGHDQILTEEP